MKSNIRTNITLIITSERNCKRGSGENTESEMQIKKWYLIGLLELISVNAYNLLTFKKKYGWQVTALNAFACYKTSHYI